MGKIIAKTDRVLMAIVYVIASFFFFSSTVGTMNSLDAPQFALTQALVESKRTNIDGYERYAWPDVAYYNNKTYTDREPGLSFLAIPLYKVSKMLLSTSSVPLYDPLDNPEQSKIQAITYGLMGMIAAIAPVILFLIARELGSSSVAAFYAAMLFASGTLFWKYSASFVRQPFTALFFLMCILMLIRYKNKSFVSDVFLFMILGYLLILDHLSIAVVFSMAICYVLIHIKLRTPYLTRRRVCMLSISLFAPLALMGIYNYVSFDSIFTSPRLHSALPGVANASNIFIADLYWSIPINLFSYKPIPPEAFHFFKEYPQLAETFSMYKWASVWQYKGIFVQTPALFLGVIGMFFIKSRWLRYLLSVCFLAYFVPASKILVFFSPTAYDTRYVLPSIAFIVIGMPIAIDVIYKLTKGKVIQKTLFTAVLVLVFAASFLQALYSVSQHFAAHVTGEHRFTYVREQPIKDKIFNVVSNAFPNVTNIHIYLLGLGMLGIFGSLYKKIDRRAHRYISIKNSRWKSHERSKKS